MAEKVINEFRVIETDDGYRIEIKGDKEHLKKFLHGSGRHGWRHHGFRGPMGFGFGHMMGGKGPCCDSEEHKEEDTA
jgi:hypothetical protein